MCIFALINVTPAGLSQGLLFLLHLFLHVTVLAVLTEGVLSW